MFETAPATGQHLFLSHTSIQSMPSHHIYLNSSLILYSYACLSVPSGLFPSFPHQNPVRIALLLYICHMLCHLINLVLLTQIFGKKYKSLSSSLLTFPQFPVTSSRVQHVIFRKYPQITTVTKYT
jgi:hypothetical protein